MGHETVAAGAAGVCTQTPASLVLLAHEVLLELVGIARVAGWLDASAIGDPAAATASTEAVDTV